MSILVVKLRRLPDDRYLHDCNSALQMDVIGDLSHYVIVWTIKGMALHH